MIAARLPTCARVLAAAVEQLGAAEMSRALHASRARIERWSTGAAPMTLEEQVALALAVIARAQSGSELFHRAARLREQVRAAIEFQLHSTETHPFTHPRLR
jgi:hypothetical protein